MAAALATMWLGLKFEYLGGSSVGCLSLGILVSFAWERGFPPYLCKGEAAGSLRGRQLFEGCASWAGLVANP